MVQPTDSSAGGDLGEPVDPDATVVIQQDANLPDIPGYRLTRHIGAGGMAHAWLAVDDNLKRQVALKTMSLALSGDEGFDQAYIVMEFIGGGTLTERLAKGLVPR